MVGDGAEASAADRSGSTVVNEILEDGEVLGADSSTGGAWKKMRSAADSGRSAPGDDGAKRTHMLKRMSALDDDMSSLDTESGMLHPDSNFKAIQDFGLILILIVYALILPYRWAFDAPAEGMLVLVDVVCEPLLMADLFLRFRTAYWRERGVLIDNARQVRAHYMKHGAVLDIFSALPMEIISKLLSAGIGGSTGYPTGGLAGDIWTVFVHLNQLARIVRAYANMNFIEDAVLDLMNTLASALQTSFDYTTSRIAKLFIVVSLLAHWFACLFYYFGKKSDGWINVYSIDKLETAWSKYTVALYYVFTTVTTVGYGDFSPQTTFERYLGIVLMLFGCTIFAFVVGLLSGSVSGFDLFNMECQSSEFYLVALMNKYRVNPELRRSVGAYYEHIKTHTEVYAKRNILGTMPYHLRRDLTLELYAGLEISSKSIVMRGTGDDLHYALLTCMKPSVIDFDAAAASTLRIVKRGDLCADLFFVHHGECSIVFDTKRQREPGSDDTVKITVEDVAPAACFGEECVLGAPRYLFDVVASSHVDLFFIDRQDFDAICVEFPDEFDVVTERVKARLAELYETQASKIAEFATGTKLFDAANKQTLLEAPSFEDDMASVRARKSQLDRVEEQLAQLQRLVEDSLERGGR